MLKNLYWFTKTIIPGCARRLRQQMTITTVTATIIAITTTEMTTAIIIASVLPQSAPGGPHFPFLQQLVPQSSSLEHVTFSQLCKQRILPSSLPQHCSLQVARVNVYTHSLASVTVKTPATTKRKPNNMFIFVKLYLCTYNLISLPMRWLYSLKNVNVEKNDHTEIRNLEYYITSPPQAPM